MSPRMTINPDTLTAAMEAVAGSRAVARHDDARANIILDVTGLDPAARDTLATRLDALAIYDVRISETDDFLKGPPADTRPGIVILDLGNGGLLGRPGIVEARALWASVPLIAVSDELTSEQTRVLVRMNASDWLHKPLDGKDAAEDSMDPGA